MHSKAVILNLRVARKGDFSDELDRKKFGCMYFQQSFDGSFCNQPYFFHEETNMEVFRELYASKQIWVLAGMFDEVEFVNKRTPIATKKSKRENKTRKKNRPCTCVKRVVIRKK
ncbi:hypothetical protein [Flavobacterium panacagri]|uniref:hypothetical protein n=1 Tax=Flavobacterium panacagri TaxID=3034146 RepID=UPI0025A618C1|nr:hypothetical protein [Flavobacterium panacagri]